MTTPDITRLRRSAACGIVFDEQGRVLLHRRTDNGRWGFPGGAIEIGETADQAAAREVEEETGYKVAIVRLVGIYSDPKYTTITYPDGNVSHYVAMVFECRVIAGAPRLCDESSAVEWFAPAALPEGMNPGHVVRLNDALARKAAAFYR